MAKRKHREQDPIINDTNSNTNNKNIPFGIDPMQLMGLLGGNFDMSNIGNMLSSMNTNGFNLGNLGSLAQMMGLNLDSNFLQENMNSTNNDINKNMYSNVNRNVKSYPNNNTSSRINTSSNIDKNNRKSTDNKNVKDNDANLDFLMALRSYVHPDRIQFIDKIIEAYKNGEFKDI
ncbi:MAG: hypothetical protein LLF98_10145 [Clostridium sp.]|uniref:hypothetical protein n=1 Tax=Clostridium sp. TaxID=1506 RepID=UPI0025BE1BAD|nr:hypothetical protein [Clostridium sp.]MCE5221597.1 hypothetical protein [Clostridium sp.]